MKDLLRLRRFGPGLRPLATVALLTIILTSTLRALAVWQTKAVFAPVFHYQAAPKPAAGGDGSPRAPKAKPTEFVRNSRVATWFRTEVSGPARQSWEHLFGINLVPKDSLPWRWRMLLAACIVLVFAGTAAGLSDLASTYLIQYTGQRLLLGVRQKLFEHLQTLPLSFFENQRSGELISRLSNDTNVLQVLFSSQLSALIAGPFTCVGLVVLMVALNWRLSLATFTLLPLVSLFAAWLGGKVKRYSRGVQSRMADLAAFVEQTVSGMRIIQAFNMEPHVTGLFQETNRATYRTALRAARAHALNAPIALFMVTFGIVVALLIGGHEVIAGRMRSEDLVTFIVAMQLLETSVSRLTRLNLTLQQAAGACMRVWEILDTAPELTDAPDAQELGEVKGHVTFQDVTFSYNGAAPVLDHLNLDIRAGEVVAVAGPSGAGKTTLANLIPRLYDVTNGAVLVDGTDVRRVKRSSLRRFMSIVPQETLLFGTSVRENIAYGKPQATMEEIIAAAQAAQAHGFISALPDGYDTQIGERGVKLSGGQRQRIAIARALLRDPRILILDEATSSLDAESESAVQEALGRLLHGRTALIIAHRLSTIRDADRILVMECGRIVEEGTHDQLMGARGLYRALYDTQLKEQKAPVNGEPAAAS